MGAGEPPERGAAGAAGRARRAGPPGPPGRAGTGGASRAARAARAPLAAALLLAALAGALGGGASHGRPAAAQAPAGPARLDRHLRALQAAPAAPGPLRLEDLGGAPAVDVVVQGTRDVARELAAAGAAVRTSLGRGASRVHTARVPLAALARVAAVPGVVRVAASVPLRPLLDASTTEAHTQAQKVWEGVRDGSGRPVTGKGVIVAFVDTGLDWSHPDFVTPDGRTRLLALWDQTAAKPATQPGPAYGRVWSKAQIDAWLSSGITPGATCTTPACAAVGAHDAPSEADDLGGAGAQSPGHGTHVAAIAASNGRAGSGTTPAAYKGVAPDADILLVKSPLESAQILDAWDWIVAQAAAAGKPVVVNSSFGAHLGAHDGTHELEVAIDSLSRAGVIFTVAAGNSGTTKAHGAGVAALGSPSRAKVAFEQQSGLLHEAAINLWYRRSDTLTIAVVAPDGTIFGPVARGDVGQFAYPTTTTPIEITIDHNEVSPSSHATAAVVKFRRASGIAPLVEAWTLLLSAVALGPAGPTGAPAPGRWDGWIETAAAGRLVWLDPATGGTSGGLDPGVSLTEPATAARAVVAASSVSKAAWVSASGPTVRYDPTVTAGAISPFSSRGTTRDGRQKPDVAAPGQAIVAALTSSCAPDPVSQASRCGISDTKLVGATVVGARHRVLEGTSMAASHAAGVVALMLQVRPALTPEEALALLRDNALRDADTGLGGGTTWNTTFGAGKLRALAPVQTAQALAPGGATATPTAMPSPTATGSPMATATPSPTATETATAASTETPTATSTRAPTATMTRTATATATRTPTPTRTATPTPVNELIAVLSLRRAAPPPGPAYETDVTLAIHPSGTVHGSRTPLAAFSGRTDETGTLVVVVPGGLDGRFDFVAKPAGAVSRELNAVNVDRGVAETLRFGDFAEGDATGDDAADAADLAVLLAAFGRRAGEAGYDARADFDRDGAVTLLDFSLLARAYGLTGPVQAPVQVP